MSLLPAEIRWHARAGQGAVTAAKMLAECAIMEGKFAQAMPEFGPERRGAPMKAYNRISENPIRIHCHVTHPTILVFLDPILLKDRENLADLGAHASVFVNTPLSPENIALRMNTDHLLSFCTLDADRISKEATGILFPNLPMLGAVARATGILSMETVKENVRKNLGEKVGAGKIASYLQGIERGFREAQFDERQIGQRKESSHE